MAIGLEEEEEEEETGVGNDRRYRGMRRESQLQVRRVSLANLLSRQLEFSSLSLY
jgi:hypothetical protein